MSLKSFLKVVIGYIQILVEIFSKKDKLDGPKIILLNHHFDQDIFYLLKSNSIYDIRIISSYTINRIFRGIVKYRENEWDKFHSTSYERDRKRYKKFFINFIMPIFKILNIKLFISPSDIYPYLRDIIPVLRREGIKTIVIDKEGTISPYFFTFHAKEIKNKYPLISDYILVWSNRQKKFWELAGAESNQIRVVGQQRSDFWFSKEDWENIQEIIPDINPDYPIVLFFSFMKSAYIAPQLYYKGEVSWDELFYDTHKSIIELAQNNEDINFIIKTHPQQKFNDKKIIQYINSLENIFLEKGAKISNHLIVNSDVVAGFLTTALIESMVCGKPIVYPFWGDVKEKWSENVIPFHKSKALYITKNKEDFKNNIMYALRNPEIPKKQEKNRRNFINEFFNKCNGKSSLRTIRAINEIIS